MNTKDTGLFLQDLILNSPNTRHGQTKIVLTGNLALKKDMEIEVQDSGFAVVATVSTNEDDKLDGDNGVYVNIVSWDENKKHSDMGKLLGKKIKVTIETID